MPGKIVMLDKKKGYCTRSKNQNAGGNMKFKMIALMLILVVFSLSAHLLEEGFETCYIDSLTGDTIIPGGWQIVDGDGDSFSWETYQYTPHSGVYSLTSESWRPVIGPLTPDNWVISPLIEIPVDTIVSWWIATQDVNYPAESYGVFVSVTGNTPEDFTDEIFFETLGADHAVWQQRVVDLDNYAGESIYLAWRHYNCTDNYKIKLDDIIVTDEDIDNDIAGLIMASTIIDKIYPNPFNPETTISFVIEEDGMTDLSIYNIKGQLVGKLVHGDLPRGRHSVVWQAEDQPSGMYLFRLSSNSGVSNGKALLLK
jgi:hypothetical protein